MLRQYVWKGVLLRAGDKRNHLIVIYTVLTKHLVWCLRKLHTWRVFTFSFVFFYFFFNSHVLLSFFPLIRTEFYPKAVRSLWTSNSSRTGILCGNGAPPQRLLYQCRVRCWYWKWRSDVSRACHETLGQGGQVRAQFLSVEPFQLSPHSDWYRTREQVRQWKW